jgi:hypothetical protein
MFFVLLPVLGVFLDDRLALNHWPILEISQRQRSQGSFAAARTRLDIMND